MGISVKLKLKSLLVAAAAAAASSFAAQGVGTEKIGLAVQDLADFFNRIEQSFDTCVGKFLENRVRAQRRERTAQ